MQVTELRALKIITCARGKREGVEADGGWHLASPANSLGELGPVSLVR